MIKFENINVNFGEKILYENFNIEFEEYKINFIMGESGVGKTTLLNKIKEELLNKGKNVSFVFQESRLIPWKNIYKNLEIIIMNEKSKDKRKEIIEDILKKVGLEDYKNYYPYQLSGGMKQRVNIARAILYDADIVLMDEPFKALDKKCKEEIMNFIKTYIKSRNKTAIIITHDYKEVEKIGEKLIVLKDQPVKIEKYKNITPH